MPARSLSRRSPCPVAGVLDLVGDRWTLLVVRDLLLGRRRFDEFLASPEGIATNILADRLRFLQERGLVEKLADEADGRRYLYSLTPAGLVLKDLLVPIARWGLKHLPGTRAMKGSEKALGNG